MKRANILKDMDRLHHSKENGFYDKDMDLYFKCLNKWCKWKHGTNLAEVL